MAMARAEAERLAESVPREPLTSMLLTSLIAEAGFPPGAFSVLPGLL